MERRAKEKLVRTACTHGTGASRTQILGDTGKIMAGTIHRDNGGTESTTTNILRNPQPLREPHRGWSTFGAWQHRPHREAMAAEKNYRRGPGTPLNLARPSCKRDHGGRKCAPETQFPQLAVDCWPLRHLMWLLTLSRQSLGEAVEHSGAVTSQRTLWPGGVVPLGGGRTENGGWRLGPPVTCPGSAAPGTELPSWQFRTRLLGRQLPHGIDPKPFPAQHLLVRACPYFFKKACLFSIRSWRHT